MGEEISQIGAIRPVLPLEELQSRIRFLNRQLEGDGKTMRWRLAEDGKTFSLISPDGGRWFIHSSEELTDLMVPPTWEAEGPQ